MAKLDWDQPLSADLLGRWNSLKANLEAGQSISIPRCYFDGVSEDIISCTLCGFYDASLKAYAGLVYLLIETESGFLVQFVAAKTRVSPLKEQTIPRLELLSALLLSRLLTSVTESLGDELQLLLPRCFTDSTVALYWIKGALAYRKQPLQKWALLFCYYFLYIIIIIIMYRIKFSFKWYLCLWFCGCGLLVM